MKTNTKSPSSSVKSNPASRLGDRGFQVLGLVCEELAIRVDLAARILGMKPSAVVPIVNRLERLGLVEQERFLVREDHAWFWPTRAGVRLDGRGYCFCEPAVGRLQHLAWVAGTRATCVQTDPEAEWVPERLLSKMDGRSKQHLADSALVFADGLVPVEVEVTRKDLYKVVANMASLVENFGGGRYYCSEAARPGVQRAVAVGGFEETIEVRGEPAFH